MKLRHLLQAYEINNITTELKEMNTDTEKAGTITFVDGINASYLLDDEEIVVSMKIFFSCLNKEIKDISTYFSYIINIIMIMQTTIKLLGNIPQTECNIILHKLGLFDNTFTKCKKVRHLEHSYSMEVIDGLLVLSIDTVSTEEY